MKETIAWAFSGVGTSVLVGLGSISMAIGVYLYKMRSHRIQEAFEKYDNLYERGGHRLKCLIPSGIHCLKSDREIKHYFQLVMTIEPHHPLRQWKGRIEKIGYKKFFDHVFKSGLALDKESIEGFISDLER